MNAHTQKSRLAGIVAALAGLVALAACAPPPTPAAVAWEPPRPVVRTVEVTHAVRFAPSETVLSADEMAALAGFLAGHDPSLQDDLVVEYPVGVASALASGRARAVTDYLSSRGFAPRLTSYPESDPGAVRVAIRTIVAAAPQCPPWGESIAEGYLNNPSGRLGCVTAGNLAAMIADPHDLLVGDAPGPADAERLALGVARLRAGGVVELAAPTAAGGE